MKKYLMTSAILLALSAPGFAGGSHTGGHGHDQAAKGHDNSDGHHVEMSAGKPGRPENASRTIYVTMKETDDGAMIFEPKSLEILKGETVRFVIKNAGELDHEFVLDDHRGVMEHKALMEKFPEMEHDDPNSVRLKPGRVAEIFWAFTKPGDFEFACLIPGHYDAGMKGAISLTEKLAIN